MTAPDGIDRILVSPRVRPLVPDDTARAMAEYVPQMEQQPSQTLPLERRELPAWPVELEDDEDGGRSYRVALVIERATHPENPSLLIIASLDELRALETPPAMLAGDAGWHWVDFD